jgi:hypothetical protein
VVFAIFDLIHFSVSPVGVDVGYFLSISRDWVNLGRIPGVDTFTAYTTIGYVFYAIPFVLLKTPGIEVFLTLNLMLFAFTYFVYFQTINSLISNKLIAFVVLFSFIYNIHGITTDIKLENITLFLNIAIIYVLSQLFIKNNIDLNNRKVVIYSVILGLLSSLSFLTKQYGGLSLILIILILEILEIHNRRKIAIWVTSFFGFVILVYVTTQIALGLNLNDALQQMMGKMTFQCGGSEYGERKWSNLLLSLKYNRFDVVYIVGVILSLILVSKQQKSRVSKVFNYVLLILILVLSQTPFYFQVFPHYKIFGLPFILLLGVISIGKIEHPNVSYLPIFGASILVGFALLSCYSFYCWGIQYQQKLENKISRLKFEVHISKSISRGSEVFMLMNRKHWFTNQFVTPVPKTISYGYLGLDCLELAVDEEKPKSFWVIGGKDLPREKLPNYSVIEQHDFDDGHNKYNAVHFVRDKMN